MSFEKEGFKVLESSESFSQRESEFKHTPYQTEVMFYSCIKDGNTKKATETMNELLSQTVVIGKLSMDGLRQMKYLAVCCITLATRYAISGGLNESTAFRFSDEAILKIDSFQNAHEIIALLKKLCFELTELVAKSKASASYPYAVRHCIQIIDSRLHEKLSLKILADECGLSPDYLSSLFKKTTGQTVSSYVRKTRLEASKEMLKKYATSEVAYYLGFCSESYFIKCFREQFGITPQKYISQNRI